MALRNLDVVLVNVNGTPVKEKGIDGVEIDAVVRQTIRLSLAAGPMKWEDRALSFVPDANITPEKKLMMFDLVHKLKNAGNIDLKQPEIELIKDCVKHMMPFVYGQINAALEAEIPPA